MGRPIGRHLERRRPGPLGRHLHARRATPLSSAPSWAALASHSDPSSGAWVGRGIDTTCSASGSSGASSPTTPSSGKRLAVTSTRDSSDPTASLKASTVAVRLAATWPGDRPAPAAGRRARTRVAGRPAAFSARASCCHPKATVRSRAIRVVGRRQEHAARHGVLDQRSRRARTRRPGAGRRGRRRRRSRAMGRTGASTPSWPAGRRGCAAAGRGRPGAAAGSPRPRPSIARRNASSGHLGVDHDLVHPREDARPGRAGRRAVVGARRDLLVEVAVGHHAGHLDHPAELQLAPPAPRLGCPQRGDQVPRLLLQLLLGAPQLPDLLGEAA